MKKKDIFRSIVWKITFSSQAKKQARKLPLKVKETLKVLLRDVEDKGPIRKNWPNFSPLSKKKGKIPSGA